MAPCLVEVTIDGAGVLTGAQVKVSSPAFDAAAMPLRDRVVRRRAETRVRVTSHAYLLFAFGSRVVGHDLRQRRRTAVRPLHK